MSTELATWRPASLPAGWMVRSVQVVHDWGGYRDRWSLSVELRHIGGWEFEFDIEHPEQLDEVALARLLTVLSTTNMTISRAKASWWPNE